MRDLEPHWLAAVKEGRQVFGGRIDKLAFALKAVDSPEVVGPLLQLIRNNRLDEGRTRRTCWRWSLRSADLRNWVKSSR